MATPAIIATPGLRVHTPAATLATAPTSPSFTRVPLPLAAPGWQRDPLTASRLRFFDGQNWTDAVACSGR